MYDAANGRKTILDGVFPKLSRGVKVEIAQRLRSERWVQIVNAKQVPVLSFLLLARAQ